MIIGLLVLGTVLVLGAFFIALHAAVRAHLEVVETRALCEKALQEQQRQHACELAQVAEDANALIERARRDAPAGRTTLQ